MGAIIVQSDLEAMFGTTNVAVWSNLDNETATANTTRINAAINYAESFVNNRFRSSRYAVPLAPSGPQDYEVVHWCCVIAARWLYDARRASGLNEGTNTSDLDESMRRVMSSMDSVVDGSRAINYAYKTSGGAVPWAGGVPWSR